MNRMIFEKLIQDRFNAKEFEKIMLAYRLSKYGHSRQTRDGGERYFHHPRRVALILITELNILDADLIVSALIHDLLEDQFILTANDVALIFGDRVKEITDLLTKKKGGDINHYFKFLLIGPREARLIKLADRLDNLRDMTNTWSKQRIMKYIKETIDFILPLADENSSLLKAKILDQITKAQVA